MIVFVTKATVRWNVIHRHPRALKIKLNTHRIYVDYFLLLNNFLKYQVFKIFFFLGHFWSLCKIFYLKRIISFVNEAKCFLLHLENILESFRLSRKKDWFIIFMRVYTEEYSWRLILFLMHACYTSIILSRILKENFKNQRAGSLNSFNIIIGMD